MTQVFQSFLLTSLIGSGFYLLLFFLKTAAKKYVSPTLGYYCWLAVLLIMMLPIRLVPPSTPEQAANNTVLTLDHNDVLINSDKTSPTVTLQTEIESEVRYEKAESTSFFSKATEFILSNTLLFASIWACVAVLLFLKRSASYLIFLAKLRRRSQIVSCPEISAYTCRPVTVRVSGEISSPLLTGVFMPILLLPNTELSTEQLHNVLAHEMIHLKRLDVLYMWIVNIVKCVHWFNPLLYFISKQISLDCEISCDYAVVRYMSKEEKKSYADTILSLLEHSKSRNIPHTTGMTGNKRTLIRRFTMIKSKIKISKKATAICAAIVCIAVVFAILAGGIINGTFFSFASDGVNFNILLIGVDEYDKPSTIMLADFTDDGIDITSLPLYNYRSDSTPLLYVFAENGVEGLTEAVGAVLSDTVDYYAKVKLSAIEEIVDSQDGVEFDVPQDMFYSDPLQNIKIDLKAGKQTLNGKESCDILRYRLYDLEHLRGNALQQRIEVQHQFISAFIEQKVNKDNIKSLVDVFKIVSKNIETNYPISNFEHDIKIISSVADGNISFKTVEY